MIFSLPKGTSPKALFLPHFPTRQQALVWRNWELVPVERIAEVLHTSRENVIDLAQGMGLRVPPEILDCWIQRGYVTIIRANWHLLPYEQLLTLLGWTREKLAYTLKEDDFLFIKLGNHKPKVETIMYIPLTEEEKSRTNEIKKLVKKHFPNIADRDTSKPFDFLKMFLKPKNPIRRQFNSASPDEVVIDGSWNVSYPAAAKCTYAFVERFVAEYESSWGIKLSKSEKPVEKKNIALSVKPDPGLLSESHTITIDSENIYITAVDEVGLLRGLQWLDGYMEKRGGPFLKKGVVKRKTRFDIRLIYSYFATYGNLFEEPVNNPFPEGLLSSLSKLGINGIWLQGVLYSLVPWEAAPELSCDRERKIEGLRNLIERAADYGIGVYLYLNEPRSMPHEFFEKYPELKGHMEDEFASICTSQKPTQDYLRNGVAQLFRELPELAGIITITMSENLTNCYSRAVQGKTNCSSCVGKPPQKVIAEVNRLIAEGAHSVKPDARIICWTWGWNQAWGWNNSMVKETIELLPDNVSVMCTSEDEMPINIAGIRGIIEDYSISIIGPSEKSINSWQIANKRGLPGVAKVQFNNSWECSAVPYLPVTELIEQHLKNLLETDVTGLMLGWTLGGYPSFTLELVSQYYWEQDNGSVFSTIDMICNKFGQKAGVILYEAFCRFSNAFKEFPFHLMVLYKAPQNFGPANLLYKEPTGFKATMLGYPYDDIENWRGNYPRDLFESQFEKLSIEWKSAFSILSGAEKYIDDKRKEEFKDLFNVAAGTYCHFRSTYIQIAYMRLRDCLYRAKNSEEHQKVTGDIINIINEEIEIAKMLHDVVRNDSRIGYEASNHYYYTLQDLREKVINCENLLRMFSAETEINPPVLDS